MIHQQISIWISIYYADPLVILMLSSIFIDWWLLEINAINCRHGAIIYANCSFHIRINPPINDKLDCVLRFFGSNHSNVKFINKQIKMAKSSNDSKCPFFTLIKNVGNQNEEVIGDIYWLIIISIRDSLIVILS